MGISLFTNCDTNLFSNPIWRYEVTGTAETVNITFRDAQGNIVQRQNVELPWNSGSFEPRPWNNFIGSISAQNNGREGYVTVRIIRDGSVRRNATSEGAFAIASATYHFIMR